MYKDLPSTISVIGDAPQQLTAARELQRGLSSILGRQFTIESLNPAVPSIAITTAPSEPSINEHVPGGTREEMYLISRVKTGSRLSLDLEGETPQATIYAAFRLLGELGAEQLIPDSDMQRPSAPIRWVDEWDNLNGTIERGYAGPSIFFENGHVRQDLTRAGEYARLLASIGINGCNVNNVNADLDLLTTEHLKEFARIADVFRPWGVKLALSIDLTSPADRWRIGYI